MSNLVLTAENFDQIVLQSDTPVLVDFWAPWCGPCRAMAPILEELAREMENVTLAKLNVDEHSDIAQRYNILSIPTFILFKKGVVLDQFSGSMTKDMFRNRIEKHV